MSFYHFRQNNSGGNFHIIPAKGIGVNVIIEGNDINHIIERAEQIGLYFNGCDDGIDCPCCGDRWRRPYHTTMDSMPLCYGRIVEFATGDCDLINGFIHYLNGTIVPFKEIS